MIIKIFKIGLIIGALLIVSIIGLNYYIQTKTSKLIHKEYDAIKHAYTGLVFGARVYENGNLSGILKDRVDAALDLYQQKKIKRFLLSGDHGRKEYDEVNSMKNYLIKKGVPERDIFLDHAGFDTYNSIYRAKYIFNITDVILITQEFHIKRAVFIAKSLDLDVQGIIADKHSYGIAKRMFLRELLANVKAFLELKFNKKPVYMGNTIPITGNSKLSYD